MNIGMLAEFLGAWLKELVDTLMHAMDWLKALPETLKKEA